MTLVSTNLVAPNHLNKGFPCFLTSAIPWSIEHEQGVFILAGVRERLEINLKIVFAKSVVYPEDVALVVISHPMMGAAREKGNWLCRRLQHLEMNDQN